MNTALTTTANIALSATTFTKPGYVPTMSSQELAHVAGKRHDNVIRDIWTMIEEIHGIEKCSSNVRNEQNQTLTLAPGVSYETDYRGFIGGFHLDRDHCECLIAGYDAAIRMKVIRRLRFLEEQNTKQIPQSFAQALQLAANLEAEKEQLLLINQEQVLEIQDRDIKISEDAPKVELYEAVAGTKKGISVGDWAKELGLGRTKLFEWLRKEGYLQASNVPYGRYLTNTKWFEVRKTTKNCGGYIGVQVFSTTLVTGLGQVKLGEKLIAAGLVKVA